MKKRKTSKPTFFSFIHIIILCLVSAAIGSVLTFALNPTLQEVTTKRAQCLHMTQNAKDCKVKITVEAELPLFRFQQYR